MLMRRGGMLSGIAAGILFFLLGGFFAGCSPEAEEGVVARVFTKDITAEEFGKFVAGLPEGLRSQEAGIEGHVENLQSLIDKELLVFEARKRGLEQDREFLRKVGKERDQLVLKEFFKREIQGKIEISDDELRAYFAKTGRDREVKIDFLTFGSEAEARDALDEIDGGAAFQTLRERLKPDQVALTQDQRADRFLGKDALSPNLRERVFSLSPGQISEPIAYQKRYLLIQLVDERPADFEKYRSLLHGKLAKEKFAARRKAVLEELEAKHAPRLDEDGLKRLLAEGRTAFSAMEIDPEIPVFVFEGGTITSGRLIDQIKNRSRLGIDLGDSAQVVDFVRNAVVTDVLLLAEARRLGLDEEARAAVDEKIDKLLVDELLLREVESKIRISYDEAKAYFAEHPETFSSPELVEVQEILVGTEAEARQLLEQLQGGADVDVDALADERTLRSQGKGHGGRFHFHRFEAPLYEGLVEAAWDAPLHQLQGPVEVEGGYSLFWVLSRDRKPLSFDDKRVQFMVKNVLTKVRQNELFDAFVAELRARYRDEVRIFKGSLRQAAI